MNDPKTDVIAKVTRSATWIGVGLIVLGILALFLPQQSGIAVAAGAGVLLLLAGVLQLGFLFFSLTWGSLLWRLLFGLAAVLAGLSMIFDPASGLRVLTIVTIAYFLVDGVAEILLGLQYPPGGGGLWIVSGGVLSLLLAFLMWRSWPISGEVAVPILIGVKLVYTGIVVLIVARASRAIAGRA
jgi:uncharacterized membrane protein HdeD (DUF308 family)